MYRLHRNQVSQLRRDLYENDSLVIAKILVEPLSQVDERHKILFQYVKRLAKNQCNLAIDYLLDYALQKHYFGRIDCLKLKFYRFIGFFRYKLVFWGKKILILFRK